MTEIRIDLKQVARYLGVVTIGLLTSLLGYVCSTAVSQIADNSAAVQKLERELAVSRERLDTLKDTHERESDAMWRALRAAQDRAKANHRQLPPAAGK